MNLSLAWYMQQSAGQNKGKDIVSQAAQRRAERDKRQKGML